MTACRDRHGCWGSVELMREQRRRRRSTRPTRSCSTSSRPRSAGCSVGASSRVGGAERDAGPPLPPATLILDADLRAGELDAGVRAMADRAARRRRRPDAPAGGLRDRRASAHASPARRRACPHPSGSAPRAGAGRSIEGAPLEGAGRGHVAITIRAASADEIFDLLCKTYDADASASVSSSRSCSTGSPRSSSPSRSAISPLHRPGSPEGGLRQDARPQPARARLASRGARPRRDFGLAARRLGRGCAPVRHRVPHLLRRSVRELPVGLRAECVVHRRERKSQRDERGRLEDLAFAQADGCAARPRQSAPCRSGRARAGAPTRRARPRARRGAVGCSAPPITSTAVASSLSLASFGPHASEQ